MTASDVLIVENVNVATWTGPAPSRVRSSGREGNRIVAVGGQPPDEWSAHATRTVDASGCVLTPGLVNTHHHLYQWITRGLAQDSTLFQWLTTLYPIWARIDADAVHAAAAADLAWMALSGCTLSTDHGYVHPRGGGNILEAEIVAAQQIGLRFHPTRGSMNLGQSHGGLPPDSGGGPRRDPARVRGRDRPLARPGRRRDAPDRGGPVLAVLGHRRAHARVGRVGPPARRAAAHPSGRNRRRGGVLPGHVRPGPVEYAESLGWLGEDVWLAHCVHLSEADIAAFARTGTGTAHCPTSNGRLGSGIAPVRGLLDAGAPVGLGIDGAASNEAGTMAEEMHQSMLFARLRNGPTALTARDCLRLATMGGARVLGRERDLGSLEVGKLADLALWRVDGLGAVDIADPVCALVFGNHTPLEMLVVNGRVVVDDGQLTTADPQALGKAAQVASRRVVGAAAQVVGM